MAWLGHASCTSLIRLHMKTLQSLYVAMARAAVCEPALASPRLAYAEAAFTVYIFLAAARVFESFISAARLKARERWKFIWVLRKAPRRKKCLVAAVMGGAPGDSAGGWEIKQLRNGFVGRTWGILSR